MPGSRFVLRGADVVDGSGETTRRADVEVADGRIVAIGDVEGGPGVEEIDLGGLVLAPGFIDIHTHYDAQVFWEPALATSRTHGVTTVVTGNCGFTIAPTRPEHRHTVIHMLRSVEGMSAEVLEAGIRWSFESFPEYLDALRALPLGTNLGALVGHSAVRLNVMGDDASERIATRAERDRMVAIVAEAVAAGAFGFSTSRQEVHCDDSGRPVPSRMAELSEVRELCDAAAAAGARMIEVASGDDFPAEAVAELAERTHVNVTYGGLLTGILPREQNREVLEMVGRVDGCLRPQIIPMPHYHNVACAVPYDLMKMSTAFKEALHLDAAGLADLYRDPEWRRRAHEGLTPRGIERLPQTTLSESKRHPDLVGRPLPDIAAERGTSTFDALLDLSLEDDLRTRFRYVAFNGDESEVAELLQDRRTILGLSDAGAHADRVYDAAFPTRVLGHWVRETGVLDLPFAVWRLSGQPAEFLGLRDRGLVRTGYAADLVAFDPATVRDLPATRVYDLPTGADRLVGESDGIAHVWVNGVAVRRDGQNLESGPGVVL